MISGSRFDTVAAVGAAAVLVGVAQYCQRSVWPRWLESRRKASEAPSPSLNEPQLSAVDEFRRSGRWVDENTGVQFRFNPESTTIEVEERHYPVVRVKLRHKHLGVISFTLEDLSQDSSVSSSDEYQRSTVEVLKGTGFYRILSDAPEQIGRKQYPSCRYQHDRDGEYATTVFAYHDAIGVAFSLEGHDQAPRGLIPKPFADIVGSLDFQKAAQRSWNVCCEPRLGIGFHVPVSFTLRSDEDRGGGTHGGDVFAVLQDRSDVKLSASYQTMSSMPFGEAIAQCADRALQAAFNEVVDQDGSVSSFCQIQTSNARGEVFSVKWASSDTHAAIGAVEVNNEFVSFLMTSPDESCAEDLASILRTITVGNMIGQATSLSYSCRWSHATLKLVVGCDVSIFQPKLGDPLVVLDNIGLGEKVTIFFRTFRGAWKETTKNVDIIIGDIRDMIANLDGCTGHELLESHEGSANGEVVAHVRHIHNQWDVSADNVFSPFALGGHATEDAEIGFGSVRHSHVIVRPKGCFLVQLVVDPSVEEQGVAFLRHVTRSMTGSVSL